jgi:S-DNA-T family DNA segregation ATPase FtsK/SpoIIIE
MFELRLAPGIKISKVTNLAQDLAMGMQARGIRIIAPIPGKATIGIEIPNRKPQMVRLRSLISSKAFADAKGKLVLALGKTVNGEVYVADLGKMPHLLIAGTTGSGKSVGINTIIASILYRARPDEVKFVMIDPKMLELSPYQALEQHHLAWSPELDEKVVTKPENAVAILNSVVEEMDRRYHILSKSNVRKLDDYNAKLEKLGVENMPHPELNHQKLPFIVVIIDELADLMITASKEVEQPIARLAQMARAVGIHLIVATQRPSVDVLTGVIKANFPTRLAYQVAQKNDSRTILDMMGAEQLLGTGDMLFLPPGEPKPIRLQNGFISTEEVENIITHISRQPSVNPLWLHVQLGGDNSSGKKNGGFGGGDRDQYFEDAKRLVVMHQQGSVSLIQRRLKVGYARAARIMDQLEEAGVVGPFEGSKARDVLLTEEDLDI